VTRRRPHAHAGPASEPPRPPLRPRYVGVDVGGTNVRVAVWSGADASPALASAAALPGGLGSLVELVAAAAAPPVTAVAVGVPGRVAGGVAAWVPNVPYLEGRDVAGELSARLRAPVALANDGHMALLGEARFGAARGVRDALLVTVGTGIGGAIMRSGRLVRGANGTAGSFGWLSCGTPPQSAADDASPARRAEDAATASAPAEAPRRAADDASPPAAEPPQVGPWEATASGLALERRASRLRRPVGAHELVAAAAAGDREAAAVIDGFVAEFGAGLASLASLFDPQVIVVSGGVADLVAELLPRLRAVYAATASPSVRDTPVRVAELGRAAGAFGAAVYAKEGDEVYLP
jgi:predicted NBD/HSP70 family sugar kinase